MAKRERFVNAAFSALVRRKRFLFFALTALAVVVAVWIWVRCHTTIFYASHRLQRGYITGLAFAADGQWLISAGEDGKVIVWDVRRKEMLRTLWSHSTGVSPLAVDKDAKLLGAGSSDGVIKVWELPEMNERASVRIGSTTVLALAISPLDGSIIAYCGDTKIRTWKWMDGSGPTVLKENVNTLGSMALSGDGTLLAIGSLQPGKGEVLNMRNRTERALDGRSEVLCITFLGDTHIIAGNEGQLWNADCGSGIGHLAELERPPPRRRSATAMTTGPNGKGLVAGDAGGRIYVYDATASKLLGSFGAFNASITVLAVSRDGTMLAAGCADVGSNDRLGHAEVKVWKLPSSYNRD